MTVDKMLMFVLLLGVGLVVIGLFKSALPALRLRPRRLPYSVQPCLNTPTEQAFIAAVYRAVGNDAMVTCKVRIADVLQVSFRRRHHRDKRWWHFFRQISSKHVDVVICEQNGGQLLAAIELDDRSHLRADRKRRDRFVDEAFESANLPLLRFPASRRYDAQEIKNRLAPYIKSPSIKDRQNAQEPTPRK